jgi:MarR family transcriptional regulator, lower aerobic nicotinate degradation pathway regulator
VGITDRGQEVLGRMDQLIFAAEDQLLAPLTAAERKTLTGLLARLVTPSE